MSKSILVIDTPENCIGCDFSDCELREYYCERAKRYLKGCEGEESKPDWCPLRELTKKKDMDFREECSMYISRYWEGYNALIHEILKGENGNE